MKSLFSGILAACLMVAVSALASCTTLDAKIQENAPKICSVINKTHVIFVAAAATGSVSQKVIDKESKAYEIAAPYCVDPTTLTSDEILIIAAQQLIILKAAKESQDG